MTTKTPTAAILACIAALRPVFGKRVKFGPKMGRVVDVQPAAGFQMLGEDVLVSVGIIDCNGVLEVGSPCDHATATVSAILVAAGLTVSTSAIMG